MTPDRSKLPVVLELSLVAGTHDIRVLCSHSWPGITMERVIATHVNCTVRHDDHTVSVLLRPSQALEQSRQGRTVVAPLRPGQVIVTPAGQPKGWVADGPQEWVRLRLDPAVVSAVAAADTTAATTALLDSFGRSDPDVVDIAKRLMLECERPRFASDVYANAIALELAVHLLREYSNHGTPAHRPSQLPERKLRRACEFIDAHLGDDLPVDRIAAAVQMSSHHFAHAFRLTTGRAPHQYVIERRVERAKALLRDTELPITEIAALVGCSSPAHFTVLFKERMGITPSAYRQLRAP
jgi:AraC family transcriptional regulator